jgi:uncharacterized protein (TIGR03083 family)
MTTSPVAAVPPSGPSSPPPERYLQLLHVDAARITALAGRGLDAEVPACPGWTVREVVRHLGSVYAHKTACIRLGRRPDEGEWDQSPPAGEDLVEWMRARLAVLVDELRARGPAASAYTWFPPDQTVGFWFRRMAQETAVHRVDVESALDEVTPVPDDLAVDGVDEVLKVFLTSEDWSEAPLDGPGRTAEVRTGDRGWRVQLEKDRVVVDEEPGAVDVTVTGEPSELLLWLWGRRPEAAVRISGDPEAAAALRGRLVLATQ